MLLGMARNSIWWRGSYSEARGSVENLFIYSRVEVSVRVPSVVYNTYTDANHTIQILKRNSVVHVRTVLLISWLRFFDMRRETQFLKVFRNHTMLTTSFNGRNPTLCPNGRNTTIIFHGLTSKSPLYGRTPTSQNHGRTPTLTVCHWGRQPNCLSTWPKVNSQLTLFQNLQILRTLASEHDVIHTLAHFLSGVYYDNCDCHLLCARA